jgi:hypothetical protein
MNFNKGNCRCPTTKKISTADVDEKLKQIKAGVESMIESREAKFRRISLELFSTVETLFRDFQKNSSLKFLSANLEVFRDFLTKMQNLTTLSPTKQVVTCDELAETITFIHFNMVFYHRVCLESQNNAIAILNYLDNVQDFYRNNSLSTVAHKRTIERMTALVGDYAEETKQYIFAINESKLKLDQLKSEA